MRAAHSFRSRLAAFVGLSLVALWASSSPSPFHGGPTPLANVEAEEHPKPEAPVVHPKPASEEDAKAAEADAEPPKPEVAAVIEPEIMKEEEEEEKEEEAEEKVPDKIPEVKEPEEEPEEVEEVAAPAPSSPQATGLRRLLGHWRLQGSMTDHGWEATARCGLKGGHDLRIILGGQKDTVKKIGGGVIYRPKAGPEVELDAGLLPGSNPPYMYRAVFSQPVPKGIPAISGMYCEFTNGGVMPAVTMVQPVSEGKQLVVRFMLPYDYETHTVDPAVQAEALAKLTGGGRIAAVATAQKSKGRYVQATYRIE